MSDAQESEEPIFDKDGAPLNDAARELCRRALLPRAEWKLYAINPLLILADRDD